MYAKEIEGVKISPNIVLENIPLQLNGSGLRSFSLLMIPIKVYVAAFYAPSPLRSESDVLNSSGLLQFDFTFLRSVSQSDVQKAWSAQFAQSVTYTYPSYTKDRDMFIAMFGPLQPRSVESVRLVGTNTMVYDSGEFKGVIQGRDFQKAFLSLWFGKNPVSGELKEALLGK